MPRHRRSNFENAPNDRPRPPPGLRGKALGLFYRDQGRRRGITKDRSINFTIPPSVLEKVKEFIKSINIVARKENISIKDIPLIDFSAQNSVKEEVLEIKSEELATEDFIPIFKEPKVLKHKITPKPIEFPGTSSAPEFISIKSEPDIQSYNPTPLLALRPSSEYKYGYYDIITSSFEKKLTESLAKGTKINIKNSDMESLNNNLYEEYIRMVNSEQYNEMLEFRQKLPAYKKSPEIVEVISKNQVVVISGETGCGKSTQIPQILLDTAILDRNGSHMNIIVTQPRRIAASSLALRVAQERAEQLGNSVGYAVRLEKIEPRPRGSIMYCTTGVLICDLEVDQSLSKVSHVILDEVHERDTNVDIAMCILKQVLKKRKDLKLILMSATLDSERLSEYFDNCPTLHIEGLAYPVQDIYLEDILKLVHFNFEDNAKSKNYHGRRNHAVNDVEYKVRVGPWLETIRHKINREQYKTLMDYRIEELIPELLVEIIKYICKGEPGAILVFLPGIADITKLLNLMDESNCFPRSKYDIYPLHSKLPTLEQRMIFERPPLGKRKIIIATNIAETSITIDDVVYVVDSGKIKIKGLNIEDNVATLETEWVSQANLRQRRGRAGRCQPGICYHVLTSYRASQLPERLAPELQRSDLLEAVLMVKRMRLGGAEQALNRTLDPPSLTTINMAVKHLQRIGALDSAETLTPLGWHLARLPLHPSAGKLLILGSLFGCVDRAASVAAVWAFKDPFMMVIGKEREVDRARLELSLNETSDHIAMSEAIIKWENLPRDLKRRFAYDSFLSNNTLELLSTMKSQLADNLTRMGFLPSASVRDCWENRNCNNLSLFKAIIAASLYPNVGSVRWIGLNNTNANAKVRIIAHTPTDGRVHIHPSSIMGSYLLNRYTFNNPGANWLVYSAKQKSTKLFIMDVTLVYSLPLLFFGELQISEVENSPNECFISVTTIKVKCQKETADLILKLRSLLDQVMASKVMVFSEHSFRHSEFEELVLNAVIELITAEDMQVDYFPDDESDNEGPRHKWK